MVTSFSALLFVYASGGSLIPELQVETPTPSGRVPRPSASAELGFVAETLALHRPAADDGASSMARLRVELSPTLGWRGFFVQSTAVLEQLEGPSGPGTSWFEGHGLYLEELAAGWANERFGVRGGKINPAFGFLWEPGRGLMAERFAADYELTEMWGGELAFRPSGAHELSMSAFTADTSPLARSWGTERSPPRAGDGGPANTGAPTSVVLAWDAQRAWFDFSHRVSVAVLDAPEAEARRVGVALRLGRTWAVGPKVNVDLEVEPVLLSRPATGEVDLYLSASAQAVFFGRGIVTLAHGSRTVALDPVATFWEASIGAIIVDGLTVEAGAHDDRLVAVARWWN
jgi:hypothetical protein